MHPNPAFRSETAQRHLAFARERAFGSLTVSADPLPLLSHVPFLISDDGTSADLHLVRSNPIARMGETKAVIMVAGPDGYVSPDWYETDDQVPTWNYVAVELQGVLTPLPPEMLRDTLDRQSAAFEQRLAPKPPWTMAKMTPDAMARMMRQIVPFRLHFETIDGTWKLNQNKPDEVRLKAADRVEAGFGQDLSALAKLMKED